MLIPLESVLAGERTHRLPRVTPRITIPRITRSRVSKKVRFSRTPLGQLLARLRRLLSTRRLRRPRSAASGATSGSAEHAQRAGHSTPPARLAPRWVPLLSPQTVGRTLPFAFAFLGLGRGTDSGRQTLGSGRTDTAHFMARAELQWPCRRCTYINAEVMPICEVCGETKPHNNPSETHTFLPQLTHWHDTRRQEHRLSNHDAANEESAEIGGRDEKVQDEKAARPPGMVCCRSGSCARPCGAQAVVSAASHRRANQADRPAGRTCSCH